MIGDLLVVAGASLATAAVAMVVTALVARRVGRVSVVDVTWGLALAAIALVCALLGGGTVSWLLLGLTGIWAVRLSGHIYRKQRGQGEDPRYEELLDGGGLRAAVRKVFVVQGASVWLVSLPLQAAALTELEWLWAVVAGAVVWAVGLFFESVGDAQLATYRATPRDQRPPVLDSGVWAWTRHPNYFGDACVWWGLWLVGAVSGGWLPALLTVVAPVMMTHFLRNVTGARLMEQTMSQRPGWDAYAARTAYFVPRPPGGGRDAHT